MLNLVFEVSRPNELKRRPEQVFLFLSQDMQWSVHPTERALHGQEAQWWIPDADIKDVIISEESFGAILGHLREMPESEIDRKLGEMNEMRHKFFFQVQTLLK